MTTTLDKARTATPELSLLRLHGMRGGYLLMGVGLALVKWPKLPDAHTMPLYEGVTWSLLTAMSLLALLGLRYPVKMLPVLIFETTWKVLWFGVVALPQALDGGLDQAYSDTAVSGSLAVVIIAVIPWRYAWDSFVRTPGDHWRGSRLTVARRSQPSLHPGGPCPGPPPSGSGTGRTAVGQPRASAPVEAEDLDTVQPDTPPPL